MNPFKLLNVNLSCFAALGLAASAARAADLLIRGGQVIDGTGAPARRADVLVRDGRIARIGDVGGPADGVEVIEASGMVVTPGFIDTHAHAQPMTNPALENFLAMGVTTICLGQDGESAKHLAGWMRRVEEVRPGPNVVTFVGHGTVREQAGVGLNPNPSPAQIAAMQALVEEAMDLGCFGLTTGLEYQPGSFARLDELAALARPVAQAGGLVMSHMRSEDDDAIDAALSELLDQGRQAGCPVHVSHFKVTYGRGAERAEAVLAKLAAARAEGLRVTADIYPYTASYTGIGIVFPDFAKPPHDYAEVVRTRRAELAAYLRQRVTRRNGPGATLFGSGKFAGRTLEQVAAELGKPFEDVLIDDIGLGGASAAYFVMDAALQDRLLVDPHVMICSDGGPASSHPRGHGTFARVIRDCVVQRKLLSIEEAVRKMTGLPAATLGLDRQKRGLLQEGFAADILVFDPQQVRDHATYELPRQLSTGFAWVIVNGQVARRGDQATGVRAGRMLRKSARSLEAAADRILREFGGPGAAVGVFHEGRILLAKGYGVADRPTQSGVGPETNFRLASVTKQFTAMAIMLLQQRGKLSYDEPIVRFFPNLPGAENITVRHLIGHTSGLWDYEDLIPPGQTRQLLDRDVLALLEKQSERYFEPGTKFRYSNSGYALLALIVERASGQSFATFLKENIFGPVGMASTVAFEEGVSTVPRRAMGYSLKDGKIVESDQSLTSAVLGDGGIYTSVLDYFRWDQALYAGFPGRNWKAGGADKEDSAKTGSKAGPTGDAGFTEQVFPVEPVDPAASGALADGTPTNYGFGWRLGERHGERLLYHEGETCGFNNAVRRVPSKRLTVLILTNRAGKHAGPLADRLLDWLLTDEASPLRAPAPYADRP